jgi:hypothetical protein
MRTLLNLADRPHTQDFQRVVIELAAIVVAHGPIQPRQTPSVHLLVNGLVSLTEEAAIVFEGVPAYGAEPIDWCQFGSHAPDPRCTAKTTPLVQRPRERHMKNLQVIDHAATLAIRGPVVAALPTRTTVRYGMRISLLHATYRRPGGPLAVREAWLDAAARPDTIEYVVAMDDDDVSALNATTACPRAVSPAQRDWATSVRNWNAAAKIATGDLLVVIADDLFPSRGWDTVLLSIVGSVDPTSVAYAVKVTDSPSKDDLLLRHPIVSRAYYQQHGLFSDRYHGVYCDDDFTRRSFWNAMIIDGRRLVFEHRRARLDPAGEPSESTAKVNAEHEYRHGLAVYTGSWPRWQRVAKPRFVSMPPCEPRDSRELERLAARQRRLATMLYALRELAIFVWRVLGLIPSADRALRALRNRLRPSSG